MLSALLSQIKDYGKIIPHSLQRLLHSMENDRKSEDLIQWRWYLVDE